MKTIWHADDCHDLCERLARLTPEAAPLWGGMTAPQMVVHLCDGFRMATGELPCVTHKGPLRFFPLKQIVIYWLPFPKNVPTAPELLSRIPDEWTAEMQQLRTVMQRVVDQGPSSCSASHPIFGALSGRTWGVLAYKHVDHHLRQFRL